MDKVVLHHSVGVVVFRQELSQRNYLLLRYPEGHIDFVKGHIDDVDVDLLSTAKRELLEETGIAEVDIKEGFFKTMNYNYTRDNILHKKRVDYYLGEVNTSRINISHEHTDFFWLEYLPAKKFVTFKNAVDILDAAEKFLSSQ
jgi:bis(5'-nucleosidyl)-tetraphosphatase